MAAERIIMAHGGGGALSQRLLAEVILPELSGQNLDDLTDAAVIEMRAPDVGGRGERLAFTTDSFVVKPLFFRGGDIGRLAVAGTVNDLAVSGAIPRWLSVGLIIEEGLSIEDLRRILKSLRLTAEEAEVEVVCGDTKVVGRGEADGLFINTAGIGVVREGVAFSPRHAKPGDAVIVTGSIGDHGVAVMSERRGIGFDTPIVSDVAPLGQLIAKILDTGADIRTMRDPTRGGVAASLNEIADSSDVTITLSERDLPVSTAVASACDMLGLDVLSVANEGKALIVCAPTSTDIVLEAARSHPLGLTAKVIGTVGERCGVGLVLSTAIGGVRIVDMPYGEVLARIC